MADRAKPRRRPKITPFHGVVDATDKAVHVVGIGPLRVVIAQEDGGWFAQALEIDYVAQGSSLEDVQNNFSEGFTATIDEYLKVYGSINELLKPAPAEVWRELVFMPSQQGFDYVQVSIHELPPRVRGLMPFGAIQYMKRESATREPVSAGVEDR